MKLEMQMQRKKRPTLADKLHPRNFTAMSPKMTAIVACILEEDWTKPKIAELTVTSDGCVLARHEGDCGFNDFIGAMSDLKRNWDNLLVAAELTVEEKERAKKAFERKVGSVHV